jgi:hypothetical protein
MLNNPMGLYVTTPPSRAVSEYIYYTNPGILLGMDNGLPILNDYPNKFTIGRSYIEFPDNREIPTTLESAATMGFLSAKAMLLRYSNIRPTAWMTINERHPNGVNSARNLGAYEAGAASYIHSQGFDYVAGNWSVGTPEPEIIIAYLEGWDRHYGGIHTDGSHVFWGYHGYKDGKTEAWYMERRPFDIIKNTRWPWIMSEAGFDAGPGFPNDNGFQNRIGEVAYANYIRDLPSLVPECMGFCLYLLQSHDPKWDTFEFIQSNEIASAIRNINNDTIININNEEIEKMLRDEFPRFYNEWIAAGGDPDGDFRRHLAGIGVLAPTEALFNTLCEAQKSLTEQIRNVGLRFPKG